MSAKRQQATKSKCTESKIPKLMDPTMQQVNESENNASNAFFSLCSVQTSVPSTSESKNINKQLARDGSECILIENFNESGRITQISSVKPSADTSEFSVPTSLSDVMLIVEGKRLHVNRAYLAHHSDVFYNMLFGEFIESQQQEITLTGPENLKCEEFVTLLKVIFPPLEEITAETCEIVLKLADFYQMEHVIKKCDKFLKNNSTVSMEKKLLLVDKYNLLETKNVCLKSDSCRSKSFVRNLIKKPEYSEMSAEFKNVLFENFVNDLYY